MIYFCQFVTYKASNRELWKFHNFFWNIYDQNPQATSTYMLSMYTKSFMTYMLFSYNLIK